MLEIRSETDRLAPLQQKMEEYLDSGAQLGWLIDPARRKVYVYRPGAEVERLDNPKVVSGEPFLPGCRLAWRALWP